MKSINIFFYLFLSLTLVNVAVHFKQTIYFENPSNEITEKIYTGQFIISTHLKLDNDNYVVNCSFNHIATEIAVNNINLRLTQSGNSNKTELNLKKVLPYSGMHNLDIPEFNGFSEIPDSLRRLSPSDNPYFAYDFFFKQKDKIIGDQIIVNVSIDLIESGQAKNVIKELKLIKKSKLEVKPLDAHSDILFFLIPITGLLAIIILIIKVLLMFTRRSSVKK